MAALVAVGGCPGLPGERRKPEERVANSEDEGDGSGGESVTAAAVAAVVVAGCGCGSSFFMLRILIRRS